MSVFEEACYLSNQRWISSLPEEFEPLEFSKRHQKQMRILFDKMRRDKYHRFTKRATLALIAAIIAISMTITAFAIPSTREFIIHKFFEYSTYSVVGGEANTVDNIKIGYIPEGFEKTSDYKDDSMLDYIYKSLDNLSWFEIRKTMLNQNTDFDTQQYHYEEVKYNNTTYIYYKNNSTKGYIWNNSNYVYVVSGNISKEVLFNIALSVSE